MEHTLRVRRLDPRATLPMYHSDLAAGLDLSACLPEPVTLAPGRIALIPTGLVVAIAPGFEGQVRPRSGLSTRHGVTMPNTPGTIDADYRGPLIVPLINLGRDGFVVEHGLRIAQMVIAPVVRVRIEEVADLDPTARGVGGFGSTGR
ncbi:MAG: dUTP diphosphatase [Phycisphaerales bacterium]|nr:dUTP diphosphatase [Phycisphaerales bacterium]